jgi:DNA-binding CsgD family transcriptional regulator
MTAQPDSRRLGHVTGYVVELDGEEYALLEWSSAPAASLPALTACEREVMNKALRGLSNRQIALERGTSYRTVANQMARVFAKLGVASRSELFARFGLAAPET